MSCTLIIGRDEDLCSQLVLEKLFARGQEVVYLAEDQLFPGLDLAWDFDGRDSNGAVGTAGRKVPLSGIDGVLARCYGIATSAEDFQTRNGQYLSSEWHALLRGYLQAFTCPVINRLRSELWYKPHLLATDMIALIPGLPFSLPRSMVTTRIDDARDFFRACGNRIRYSPLTLSSNYILDREADLEKLESLSRLMPLFLSEIIPGTTVNAFVVGRDVVFDPVEGNDIVGQHCADISARLGVTFCAFRFVKTAAGEWYCLGMDMMPALYECAEHVRATVIEHLADALTNGHGAKP